MADLISCTVLRAETRRRRLARLRQGGLWQTGFLVSQLTLGLIVKFELQKLIERELDAKA